MTNFSDPRFHDLGNPVQLDLGWVVEDEIRWGSGVDVDTEARQIDQFLDRFVLVHLEGSIDINFLPLDIDRRDLDQIEGQPS